MTVTKRPYLVAPRFESVPGLLHGFGEARWGEGAFQAFAEAQGMRPVVMHQLHSDVIHRIEQAPARRLDGDALMTNIPGLLLVVRTADCLPVLLADETNRAVAAVHCGWRGTEKRILEKAVGAMGEAYGSKPERLMAALGPCIGAACYEVGPEVRDRFLKAGFPESVFAIRGHVSGVHVPLLKPKYLLDLRAANVWLLRELGLARANVFSPGAVCTHCEPRLLSYRRNPHDPRRMDNFIGLV